MAPGGGAHLGVGVPERSEFVVLVLEQVRVDRSRTDTRSRGQPLNLRCITGPSWQVPEHVQREGRADPGQRVDLARVAELLVERNGRGRLQVLAEARAGVREPPGRQLDSEIVERPVDEISYAPHPSPRSALARDLRVVAI